MTTQHMAALKKMADERKAQRKAKAAWNAETKRVRLAREAKINDELCSTRDDKADSFGTLGTRLGRYGI